MAGAGYGLPRSRRLLKPAEFAATMKRGSRSRDELFSVFALANTLTYARLGLAVSKRVSPKAVVRNRIKRRVRECFRTDKARFAGFDLVIVAQGPAAAAPFDRIRSSLAHHWERATRCKSS